MLGKMIKHEFKATARLYLPLFAAVMILTPVLSLLFRLTSNLGEKSMIGGIVSGFCVFGFVVTLIGLCISAIVFVVIRFYKTVATSEAYLTFCLPVKPRQILFSKLLVGVIWEILSVGIVLLSIYLTLLIQGSSIPDQIIQTISQAAPIIAAEYGSTFLFFVHVGLIILVSSISGTLAFFLAICLGQLFNEHRVALSVAMYMAIYMASQVISTVVFMPALISGPSTLVIGDVTATGIDFQGLPTFGLLTTVVILQVCLAAAYFIGCSLILKKKTNVR